MPSVARFSLVPILPGLHSSSLVLAETCKAVASVRKVSCIVGIWYCVWLLHFTGTRISGVRRQRQLEVWKSP